MLLVFAGKCPNCGDSIKPEYRFCPKCGYGLENDGVLYHYTSIETLNAILDKIKHVVDANATEDGLEQYFFKLRATHWKYLNDPLEYQFMYHQFLNFFDSDDDLRQYKQAFESAIGVASELSGTPFVISLSKTRDNLDMWRSYSKNGSGVAIGFDREELYKAVKRSNNGQFTDCNLWPCRYYDPIDLLNDCVGLKEYFLDIFKDKNNIDISTIYRHLLPQFIVSKHSCYLNEREERIILSASLDSDKETQFIVKNEVNIPYREILLPMNTIKQIVVGPCSNYVLNEIGLRMQLITKCGSVLGEKIEISHSELPYRQI